MLSEVLQVLSTTSLGYCSSWCCEHSDIKKACGNLLAQLPQMGRKIELIQQKKKETKIKSEENFQTIKQWNCSDDSLKTAQRR